MSNNKIRMKPFDLALIVVTMNPELEILKRQFNNVPSKAGIIIVDNNSEESLLCEVEELSATKELVLLKNGENRGLASALNQGCIEAKSRGYSMVLLLDQDSEPEKGSIGILLETYNELSNTGQSIGCVGPTLIDVVTGLDLGFHAIVGLEWKRVFSENGKPIEITSLNGSGTLMSLKLFSELGGLDDEFFIDHVDTEWSFRVKNAGYRLFGVPAAVFLHRMGDKSFRFWMFGWKVWPWRSPLRHQYLFRNAVVLLKRNYAPLVWKFWAVIKLMITFLVHLIFDPLRMKQCKNMLLGIKKGVRIKYSILSKV